MEFIIQYLNNYGTVGLFVIALAESIFSPVLPDLLLIPMAIANPQNAVYYGMVATVASVLGGLIGYAIGKTWGLPVIKRFIPLHYIDQMRLLADKYGAWAVYAGALLPIPYKVITLTAGMFDIRLPIFILASVIGRAKRFLLEGILIYYFGPKAIALLDNVSSVGTAALVILVCIVGVFLFIKFVKPGRIVRGAASTKQNSSDLSPEESDGAGSGDDLQQCTVIKKQPEYKRKERR
ncbi:MULTISPECIES: YqaA family protein [Pelosinus]|uniref:SNARE associated protein n=1 Tax=Pelosinus fermentans B4 TaxID=1149862 RepID=I9LGZ1_9FIRM|nr:MULTISPECIES: YqaA family protein [Pelosinus]EIW19769.1 SNARE associated protein [Pelosinus fermentans B4]EIW21374.1 SNARE associated protein [Pelosinus fermentans A11]OAM94923.1 SNARE associated protein [Pelosinus fermentans DSM 17108]SDR20435.1 membrane protein YqaA, SNARE-associated domain [Pelosinus fermentans]